MCGIVGVIGSKDASAQVIDGLKRLEYRGYDSSGIATVSKGETHVRKQPGKISRLEELLRTIPLPESCSLAIGHTRWATHGEPTEKNAHPHQMAKCTVVHNGIIENYLELRQDMQKKGTVFNSDTDSETIPALISFYREEGLSPLEAVQKTAKQISGAFALGIVFPDDEDMLIATRRSAPLVLGIGNGANYIASDPMAIAAFTNKFIFLENDDIAVLTKNDITIYLPDGSTVVRQPQIIDMNSAMSGKAGYRHFMLKEIHEQPAAINETLQAYLNSNHTEPELPKMPFDLGKVPHITLVACGTAFYAAAVAKNWIEEYAKIPVTVDVASEFRYRKAPMVKGGLCILVSQSGETADTLAALHYAREEDQHILSIVNAPNSSIARDSDVVLYTKAGQEIAVASTKAFTTQLALFALLTIEIARLKNTITEKEATELSHTLTELPTRMLGALDLEKTMKEIARQIMHASTAIYIGRGTMFTIALEGALKLKEISYIHAEGFAAGEMKHGPIALIDEDVPVITIAPYNDLFEKTISNMKEAEARRGQSILITDNKGATELGDSDDRTVIALPHVPAILQPIVFTIPVQLLSYYVAVLKGTDVDQPRNLAKSVTVE
jgi:glucosamine--fructose-6-phosphate aminotransferase (isomerizing)